MDNSILAGKYLRNAMIENEELIKLIDPNKIFPLIANANTTFPFIVYSRTNLNAEYSKDGLVDNNATFAVIVVSDNYVQSLEIANAVRHSLEQYRLFNDDISIYPIKLDYVSEETIEDAYIQRMSFSFSVN